jgi:hypothetical protein
MVGQVTTVKPAISGNEQLFQEKLQEKNYMNKNRENIRFPVKKTPAG